MIKNNNCSSHDENDIRRFNKINRSHQLKLTDLLRIKFEKPKNPKSNSSYFINNIKEVIFPP